MFARRVIVLLCLFAAAMVILTLRLARLQIADATKWQEEARSFIHRHYLVETTRGVICDRNGLVAAQDWPSWDLAIDYRALNLEDRWLRRVAERRLIDVDKVPTRKERLKLLRGKKAEIADLIETDAPKLIAPKCGLTEEELRDRFNDIRRRVQLLKQDRWGRRYDRNELEADIDPDETIKEEQSVHTVVANLPERTALDLMQILDKDPTRSLIPGLMVVQAQRRVYPFGDVAAQVIGNMRAVDREDFEARPDGTSRRGLLTRFDMPNLLLPGDVGNLHGYLPGDEIGGAGVEAACEVRLRGLPGVRMVELGQSAPVKNIEPVRGSDVRLTLDLALQRELMQAMADPARGLRKGQDGLEHPVAVVVMNISNGEILAMISMPSYDLNAWEQDKGRLIKDEKNAPLNNRALMPCPPGSTIKPLVAMAALEEGVVSPEEAIVCAGSPTGHLFPNRPGIFTCLGVHGPITLTHALEKSCNVYFYTLGMRLGLERESRWFGNFGLGRRSGIELESSDSAGRLARTDEVRARGPSGEQGESIQEGIGQGELWVSPLQMASAYATILRGGTWVSPRILVDTPVRSETRMALGAGHVAVVRQGMELVTASGTAKSIKLKLAVAGKTGSATAFRPAFDDEGKPIWDEPPAPKLDKKGLPMVDARGNPVLTHGRQKSNEGTDAWFIGYAPAEQPQYVVAALMEFGGHGGTAATPMFKEAILALERHKYLPQMDVK